MNLEEDQYCGVAEPRDGVYSRRDVSTAQRSEMKRPENVLNFAAGKFLMSLQGLFGGPP